MIQSLENITAVRYLSTSVRCIQPLTDAQQRNKLKEFYYVLDRANDQTLEREMKQVLSDIGHCYELEVLGFSVYRGQFIPKFDMDFRQNLKLRHFKIDQNPFERQNSNMKKHIKVDQMQIQLHLASPKDFRLTLAYPDYSFDYSLLESILSKNRIKHFKVKCDFLFVALGSLTEPIQGLLDWHNNNRNEEYQFKSSETGMHFVIKKMQAKQMHRQYELYYQKQYPAINICFYTHQQKCSQQQSNEQIVSTVSTSSSSIMEGPSWSDSSKSYDQCLEIICKNIRFKFMKFEMIFNA